MSRTGSTTRPWISLNAAITLDGKIATAERRKFVLSSREDRRRMAALRDAAQAVILGAGTLRSENPPPFVREQKRAADRGGSPFTWVILTRTLDLPAQARVLRSSEVGKIIVAPERASGAGPAAGSPGAGPRRTAGGAPDLTVGDATTLAASAEVWRLGRQEIDLPALLERLVERGVRRAVLEGGGQLNFSFLQAGLVDEIFLTLCPYVLGGAAAPTVADGAGFEPSAAPALKLIEMERVGAELFLHYRCQRPQ